METPISSLVHNPNTKGLLVFFGLKNEDFRFLKIGFEKEGYRVEAAVNWQELEELSQAADCALVFLFHESNEETLRNLTQCRGESTCPWVVATRSPQKTFLQKCADLKVAEVLTYPFLAGYLALTLKKHLKIDVDEALTFLAPDIKFRLRRNWPKLGQKELEVATSSLQFLKARLQEIFNQVLEEQKESLALVVGSLGTEDPSIQFPPQRCHELINTSAQKFLPETHGTRELPETLQQSLRGQAFVINDLKKAKSRAGEIFAAVASIPVFTGDKITLYVNLYSQMAWGPETQQLAADLLGYMEELAPLLRRMDYLQRVGRASRAA